MIWGLQITDYFLDQVSLVINDNLMLNLKFTFFLMRTKSVSQLGKLLYQEKQTQVIFTEPQLENYEIFSSDFDCYVLIINISNNQLLSFFSKSQAYYLPVTKSYKQWQIYILILRYLSLYQYVNIHMGIKEWIFIFKTRKSKAPNIISIDKL